MTATKTLKLGVLGSTLAHSRSPEIQEAGLKLLGIEGTYDKFEIRTEEFDKKIRSLLASVDGLNVTIPYKEKILKYLNRLDPLAERIGAVNTLVIKDGQIYGYNTDYYGFTETLTDHDLAGAHVSIIGAGGASRAIIVALEDLKVAQIDVYARNTEKVEGSLPRVRKTKLVVKLLSDEENLSHSNLLINTTPLGQGRLASSMPLTIGQVEMLRPGTIVYDLIYPDTLFLEEARKCKLTAINGSQMLVLQGVKSLSLWTGEKITKELIATMSQAFSCYNA